MKKLLTTLVLVASSTAIAGEMETMVVTATRTQQSIDETLAPVTVIDRAEIERAQARDVLELLSATAGITITQNGGTGSSNSVFIRGNASTHTLVLVDGQRISSATLGSANIGLLEPEQIERIEVVRGPRSSLYGSEAIGGVIQIFTRKGNADGQTQPLIKLGYGNNNTSKAVLGLNAGDEGLYLNILGSHFDTQGIDNLKNDEGNNDDSDAYRNSSASVRTGGKLGKVSWSSSWLRTETENEFDSRFSPNSQQFIESRIETANAAISAPLTEFWLSTLRFGESKDESENLDDTAPGAKTEFNTRRISALWQNDLNLYKGHILTLGTDFYEDHLNSTTNYDKKERYNLAGFAQYQGELGKHQFVVGGRHEDNEQFGSQKTWNASYGLDVVDNFRLIASAGTGFNAPSFNQLYFPGFGNPNFVPEESENLELEARYTGHSSGWSLTGFRNDVENLIQFNPVTFSTDQINSATIRGAELSGFTEINAWTLRGSMTVLKPIDDASGNNLRRRARRSYRIDLDRNFNRLAFGASIRAQGHSFEDAGNTQRLGGFVLLDVRAAYAINEDLSLQLSVKNLLNKDYELTRGYESEGATTMLILSYAPQ